MWCCEHGDPGGCYRCQVDLRHKAELENDMLRGQMRKLVHLGSAGDIEPLMTRFRRLDELEGLCHTNDVLILLVSALRGECSLSAVITRHCEIFDLTKEETYLWVHMMRKIPKEVLIACRAELGLEPISDWDFYGDEPAK